MKLRIIIWTVVGILVIAGIIFIIAGGKSTQRRITLKEIKLQTERTEASLNQVTARLAQAKAVPLSPEAASSLNAAESLLTQARTLLEETKSETEPKTAEEKLRIIHRLLTRARRLIRNATKPQVTPPAGTP